MPMEPSPDDVALSLSQLLGAWRLMCAGGPAVATGTHDGVDYVFSGVPIGFFNVALPGGADVTSDALADMATRATAWAAPHDVPWMFIVTHECLAPGVGAAAALESCHMVPVLPMTGMRASQLTDARGVPDGLTIGLADDDALCAASIDINARAYAMDLAASKSLIGTRSFWKDHVLAVGTADGAPAACAAVLLVDGHRYVALVATDPGAQRRGFADAVMRQALASAASRDGDRPTVLHATDAGRPVYERMGYAPISTHTIFMERRFLEGH